VTESYAPDVIAPPDPDPLAPPPRVKGTVAAVALAGATIWALVVVAIVVARRGEPSPASPAISLVGPPTPGPAAAPAPSLRSVTGRRVDVVGDSLVHQASPLLRAGLGDAGYDATVVGLPGQSLVGEGIRARLDEVAGTGAGGDIVVVATTTNDVRSTPTDEPRQVTAALAPASYREQVTAVLTRFADRCVVMVNARDRTNPMYLPERASVLNAELARLQVWYPNLVVVDWAVLSRFLPDAWFSPDLLHFGRRAEDETPDSPSAKVYADAIVAGVRRCGPRR
jgi:hypothetical protein